ncbi:PEP-CTERM/exosortase system-associated acyltransferase [Methylovulum psychrotolerans]|uniref:PEP-CTERM/exosortase system-associated acyltransferase n=1 Tax=Methylovulum psychrotolerans TaxID=1704499 RepID=A0A2S5CGJ3_9GAMM|nr:PEP-CTERM/exosortase system-associated acyltransferase [Methylovulum psychrotolerans]POZ49919.1 PEP-CTERM/exosortase system-associated acyltransferase [Methylovulum psychrotolerans]
MTDMMDVFNQFFEMVPAVSAELKDEAYKLRYQVYCVEVTGFSNPDDFPDKREYDEYDENAVHYLIRHRKSGEYAATTRLILPDRACPARPFPLEAFCDLDETLVPQSINRTRLAEASRFCISKAFKQRKNDAQTLTAIDSANCDSQAYFTLAERRVFPHLSFALIACLIKGCCENNIDHFYGTLEPAWFRFLSSAGIHFTKIGPLADYHGLRWPGVIKVTDLLEGVAQKDQQLWNLLTDKGRFIGT